jgi:hypothetical protein
MVGQSHDSFTLLSVKNVMLFQHCEQAIESNAVHKERTRGILKQT